MLKIEDSKYNQIPAGILVSRPRHDMCHGIECFVIPNQNLSLVWRLFQMVKTTQEATL